MQTNNLPKSRRQFIQQTTLVSLGFLFLSKCSNDVGGKIVDSGLKIVKDPNKYMDLPEGFTYKIISTMGEKMDDGFLVPGRADGMGAFAGPDGKVIVVRNHENSPDTLQFSPFGKENELFNQIENSLLYDAGKGQLPGLGGTTTFIYNEETGKIEKQFMSLAGTYRNCAGGVTPWGSWLTCEEDVTKPEENHVEIEHGYVFEVPASAEGIVDPIPIKSMGRFNHEAVAVDPKTGIVYQTEDRHDGLIYRYIPDTPGNLLAGGKLQALAVKGKPTLDTRNWEEQTINLKESMEVAWIDMEDILSPDDNLRYQGAEKGATIFARGEGIWFGEGELFFACTNGGKNHTGQVFRYVPSAQEGSIEEKGGMLELFAESANQNILHCCDNLTVAPWGDVMLCEDNGERNHIRGINKNGEIYTFGINKSSRSEFAGLVFSPSGKTLFVNIQESGETLAITGPWEQLV